MEGDEVIIYRFTMVYGCNVQGAPMQEDPAAKKASEHPHADSDMVKDAQR